MGHEGVAAARRLTQRPSGAAVVMAVALIFSVVSITVDLASASPYDICSTHTSNVRLKPHETIYFSSSASVVKFEVEVVGCVNDSLMLDLAGLKVSNLTFTVDNSTVQWYEFSYISCGNYVVNIGSKTVKLKHFSKTCIHKPVSVRVESTTLLGRKCQQEEREQQEVEAGKAACRALAGGSNSPSVIAKKAADSIDKLLDMLNKQKNYDTSSILFDHSSLSGAKDDDKPFLDTGSILFDEQKLSQKSKEFLGDVFAEAPSINYQDLMPVADPTPPSKQRNDNDFFNTETFSKPRNYKENAVPIFIGIVAFTVSMCLRLCLCRGKSMVRRVTTVTVISSTRPSNTQEEAQDQQDPPPAYIDVVNENSPDTPTDDICPEPPPPSYAEIAQETLPPTYSEVEAQAVSSEAVMLTDREDTATLASALPPDPGSDPSGKSSVGRSVLSKYRSQQKQFAFKALDEEE